MGTLLLKLALGAGLGWALNHGAEGQVRAEALAAAHTYFGRTGTFTTSARSDGPFGNLSGRIGRIGIRIDGAQVTSLQLDLQRPRGPSGRIRQLTLNSTNLVLGSISIQHFTATLQDIRYRLNDALWHNRLVLVGAGRGTAEARITPTALKGLLNRRYAGLLSDVNVRLDADLITLSGDLTLFGARMPFTADGRLYADRRGRIDFVPDAVIWAGHAMPPAQLPLVTRMLNPAFNPSAELGTGELLRMTGARVADGCIVLDADLELPDAAVPLESAQARRKSR